MWTAPKARIVPVLNKEGRNDGYIVHPEDRPVRVPIRKLTPAAQRKQRAKDLL